MDEIFIKKFSYVYRSQYRKKTILSLTQGEKTPTEIGLYTNIRTNHISKILRELKEYEIVKCINEEMKMGRLYILTDWGEKIAEELQRREKH